MITIQGFQLVPFSFSASKESQRTVSQPLQPPAGANSAQIAVNAFDLEYTDNDQYGFGEFQIQLDVSSVQSASCTVTLRDNNINDREWEGSVRALVIFGSGTSEEA